VEAQKIDSTEYNHCKTYITYSEEDLKSISIQYDYISQHDTIRYLALGDFSIYVKENNYYDCLIQEILPIKGGYVIEALALGVIKSPVRVPIYIVTSSKNMYFKGRRIKKGNRYDLKFILYNSHAPTSGMEFGTNIDILIGKDILTVSCNERIKHLFVCNDFTDKKTRFSWQDNEEKISETEQENIKNSLVNFLRFVLCDEQTIVSDHFMDTVQIKKSLKKWSHPFYSKMKKNYYPQQHRVVKSKDAFHWKQYDSFRISIDNTPLRLLLKEYIQKKEPNMKNICDTEISTIRMKTIYFREFIHTYRLSWVSPNKQECILEITVQNTGTCWKIIAINRINDFSYS